MKSKLLTLLAIASALTLTLTSPVSATWSFEDGVNGIVWDNGAKVPGVTVHVYRKSTMQLEGYGVNDDNSQGALGTDITDASGYFRIAWLYGGGETYIVEAVTPYGSVTKEVIVPEGYTSWVDLCYPPPPGEEPSPGYWRHEFNAWITGKGKPHETLDNLVTWCSQLGLQYDYDQNGAVEPINCYSIFNDKNAKALWQPLAHDLNVLAGYA